MLVKSIDHRGAYCADKGINTLQFYCSALYKLCTCQFSVSFKTEIMPTVAQRKQRRLALENARAIKKAAGDKRKREAGKIAIVLVVHYTDLKLDLKLLANYRFSLSEVNSGIGIGFKDLDIVNSEKFQQATCKLRSFFCLQWAYNLL